MIRPLLSLSMTSRISVAVSSESTTTWKRLCGRAGEHRAKLRKSSHIPGASGNFDSSLVPVLDREEVVEGSVVAFEVEALCDRLDRLETLVRVLRKGRQR